MQINFTAHGLAERIEENTEMSIYRIVQEQLNNIIKHSQADNAWFSLNQSENAIELIVKDDGIGFDITQKGSWVGLQNINTRAEMHDGKMELISSPGNGSILKVLFPL